MEFLDHLRELRRRVFISAAAALSFGVVSFFLYDLIIGYLMLPFSVLSEGGSPESLFVTSIFEGFVVKMKISVLFGVILSSPVHLYNLVRFVFPGLKRREKWFVGLMLVFSFLLVGLGFYLSYFKIVPFTVGFMTSAGFIPKDVGMVMHFKDNVFYVIQLIIFALVLFQLPIVLALLLAMDLVSRKGVLKAGRFVIVGIFGVCALVTPPDFVSQISLALPLVGLFYFTILIAWIFKWGNA